MKLELSNKNIIIILLLIVTSFVIIRYTMDIRTNYYKHKLELKEVYYEAFEDGRNEWNIIVLNSVNNDKKIPAIVINKTTNKSVIFKTPIKQLC